MCLLQIRREFTPNKCTDQHLGLVISLLNIPTVRLVKKQIPWLRTSVIYRPSKAIINVVNPTSDYFKLSFLLPEIKTRNCKLPVLSQH